MPNDETELLKTKSSSAVYTKLLCILNRLLFVSTSQFF